MAAHREKNNDEADNLYPMLFVLFYLHLLNIFIHTNYIFYNFYQK
jgi:hypothetical protein